MELQSLICGFVELAVLRGEELFMTPAPPLQIPSKHLSTRDPLIQLYINGSQIFCTGASLEISLPLALKASHHVWELFSKNMPLQNHLHRSLRRVPHGASVQGAARRTTRPIQLPDTAPVSGTIWEPLRGPSVHVEPPGWGGTRPLSLGL